MTTALSPDLAVAYVRELSADVRAAVVLDVSGAWLAGHDALQAPARDLLIALDDAPDAVVRLPGGVVVAARTDDMALIAVCGPLALAGPTRLDARAAVGCTAPSRASEAPSVAAKRAAAAALLAVPREI